MKVLHYNFPHIDRKEKHFLFFLFLITVCIRFFIYYAYLQNKNRYWQVDSNTYHIIANNIATNNGIVSTSKKPNFYRLPGYPLFLAGLYKIFGHNPQSVLWIQIIIASCIPLLIFFLTLTLFPLYRTMAMTTASIGSIHLGLILYSGFFMTETIFIFFFLLFFIFFFNNMYAMSGFFLGIASLIRPVGHYLIFFACCMLLFRNQAWKLKTKFTLIFSLTWLATVSIWLVRNALLTGTLFFHTLPGGHFLYLSAARVTMIANNISYEQARSSLHHDVNKLLQKQEERLGRPLQEIESCIIHEKLAQKIFLNYPCISIKIWLTDMIRTAFSLYSAELVYLESGRKQFDYFNKDRTWLSIFKRYLFPNTSNQLLKLIIYTEIIFFSCILFGFFSGILFFLFGLMTKNEHFIWMNIIPFIVLFIIISLAGGYARMRLPIEPLLIILSLHGWTLLLSRYQKQGV